MHGGPSPWLVAAEGIWPYLLALELLLLLLLFAVGGTDLCSAYSSGSLCLSDSLAGLERRNMTK